MKYSKEFIRDVTWYIRMRHTFNFDGSTDDGYTSKFIDIYEVPTHIANTLKDDALIHEYAISKKTVARASMDELYPEGIPAYSRGMFSTYFLFSNVIRQIKYDRNGANGIEAFHQLDSTGKPVPTKHPNILKTLLKTKGSVNLHIKMYAQSLAECSLNRIEFRAWCIFCFKSPDWFRKAVETQRWKYVK